MPAGGSTSGWVPIAASTGGADRAVRGASACSGRNTITIGSAYSGSKLSEAISSGSARRPITASSSRLRSCSINSALRPVPTRTLNRGQRAAKSCSTPGRNAAATVGSTPMRSGAASGSRSTLSTAEPSAFRLSLAWRMKVSPSMVSVAPCRPRANKGLPSSASSSFSVLVTAGCVIDSACAARRRLPNCATARKHCR